MTDTPRKDGPRTLSTEEWARLRAVDDIARELVDGWDNGFPTTGGQSETDLVDRLRPFLTDPVEPAEAAAGPRDDGLLASIYGPEDMAVAVNGPWRPEEGMAPLEDEHCIWLTNDAGDSMCLSADDAATLINAALAATTGARSDGNITSAVEWMERHPAATTGAPSESEERS